MGKAIIKVLNSRIGFAENVKLLGFDNDINRFGCLLYVEHPEITGLQEHEWHHLSLNAAISIFPFLFKKKDPILYRDFSDIRAALKRVDDLDRLAKSKIDSPESDDSDSFFKILLRDFTGKPVE